MWGYKEKYVTKKKTLSRQRWHLMLDFWSPDCRNKFLLFVGSLIYRTGLWQPEQTETLTMDSVYCAGQPHPGLRVPYSCPEDKHFICVITSTLSSDQRKQSSCHEQRVAVQSWWRCVNYTESESSQLWTEFLSVASEQGCEQTVWLTKCACPPRAL